MKVLNDIFKVKKQNNRCKCLFVHIIYFFNNFSLISINNTVKDSNVKLKKYFVISIITYNLVSIIDIIRCVFTQTYL